jgi:regulator of replication initiation timing
MSTNNSVRSIRDEVSNIPTHPRGYIILFIICSFLTWREHWLTHNTRLDLLVERLDESEDVSNVWQTRCEDLERSLREAVNSAKWLRAQNEDLERRLNSHQPEIRGALDAREAAFRRLKHARKVIRDLLEERVSEWIFSPLMIV